MREASFNTFDQLCMLRISDWFIFISIHRKHTHPFFCIATRYMRIQTINRCWVEGDRAREGEREEENITHSVTYFSHLVTHFGSIRYSSTHCVANWTGNASVWISLESHLHTLQSNLTLTRSWLSFQASLTTYDSYWLTLFQFDSYWFS